MIISDSQTLFQTVGQELSSDYKLEPLADDYVERFTVSLLHLEKLRPNHPNHPNPPRAITGAGTNLAIIEAKYNCKHPSLAKLNLSGPAYVPDALDEHAFNHGTSVVGIAAGTDSAFVNQRGESIRYLGGVAPGANVSVFPITNDYQSLLKALQDIKGYQEGLGIKFDVVSISYGGHNDPADMVDKEIRSIINHLNEQGTAFFVAVGNDGDHRRVRYPARLPNVISVASTTVNAHLADTARREGVNVYCYGDGVVAPVASGNGIAKVSGSSMATPAVAGLACLAFECARRHPRKYERLHLKDKMEKMLNEKMRVGGNLYAFDPEVKFLREAAKSVSAFKEL